MNKVELFIFDMDGLLFDTGRLAYQAYVRSAEKHNYEMTHNVYYYLTGQTEADIQRDMQELYGSDAPIAEWRASTNGFKNELLEQSQRVYKKKGVMDILNFARDKGIRVALASSNVEERIYKYLDMEGIRDYFEIIVTGDEVKQGKPDPEIFLTACSKAGMAPRQAVVFEDSAAGVEAARRAGITSFLIEDNINDLPIRLGRGRYRLLKDLSQVREKPAPADYQFHDLTQAKNYLEAKELYL